jgi:hypothetical protein
MTDNENNAISSGGQTEVTLNEQEQSQAPSSATQAAIEKLKELRSQGQDFITQKLSKEKAREIAASIGNYKEGVIYNARKKLLDMETQATFEQSSKEVKAKVTVPDIDALFKDARPIEGLTPEGQQTPPQDAQQEQAPEGQQEKKQPNPVDIKTIQTISDAIHDAMGDAMRDKGKPVKPANLTAVKTTANATLEAYNASIPKWALIPILLVLEIVIFVLPWAGEIKARVEKLMKQKQQEQAEFPTE